MSQKTPPMEETKALILKAKGPAWLKQQEEKFTASYGTSIKDPALRLWLIAKQGGLEVTEIKASSDGGEGKETTIFELQEVVRKCKSKNLKDEHGWTRFSGSGEDFSIDQADDQAKYAIKVCVLEKTEGTTSTKKPKLDLVVTDGSGIAKLVAYGEAAGNLVEADCKPGAIYSLPLVNCQYGTHNFSKEKDTVWWKFALPPFGAINALEMDAREFFNDLVHDVAKENQPAVITGFITHVEEHEQEVCKGCNRWILEKKMSDHARCEEDGTFEAETRTFLNGTVTSITGQIYKLSFKTKPKVKIAVDLVEIFGKLVKGGTLDVSFIRKVGNPAVLEAPAAKPAPKAKAAPEAVEETEEQVEEEEAPAPPPKPKVVIKKAAPKPAPVEEPTEEDAEREDEDAELAHNAPPAPVVRKAAPAPKIMPKKPAPPPPVEDEQEQAEEANGESEEAEEPVVVVKAAKPAPSPAKASKAAQVTETVEVPADIEAFVTKNLKQFGGKQRIFVLTRTAQQSGKMPADGDFEALKAEMTGYCRAMVEAGTLAWTNPAQNEVKLA